METSWLSVGGFWFAGTDTMLVEAGAVSCFFDEQKNRSHTQVKISRIHIQHPSQQDPLAGFKYELIELKLHPRGSLDGAAVTGVVEVLDITGRLVGLTSPAIFSSPFVPQAWFLFPHPILPQFRTPTRGWFLDTIIPISSMKSTHKHYFKKRVLRKNPAF